MFGTEVLPVSSVRRCATEGTKQDAISYLGRLHLSAQGDLRRRRGRDHCAKRSLGKEDEM